MPGILEIESCPCLENEAMAEVACQGYIYIKLVWAHWKRLHAIVQES